MDNRYNAVVVATDEDGDVLFAKKSYSRRTTLAILGYEMVRLLSHFDGNVTLSKEENQYGDVTITATYHDFKHALTYTVNFDTDTDEIDRPLWERNRGKKTPSEDGPEEVNG